nr:MAG TPA: hypothetical protein [Caudoviricetes sp.]
MQKRFICAVLTKVYFCVYHKGTNKKRSFVNVC